MTITYEEALSTLQSMFSHQGYTTQQLDAVLRHHGGHMEHTVETILSHGENSTPEELMGRLKDIPVDGLGSAHGGGGGATGAGGGSATGASGGGAQQQHSIDADEELARQLAAEDERASRSRRSNSGGAGPGAPHATGRSSYGNATTTRTSGGGSGGGGIGLGQAIGNLFGAQQNPPPGQKRRVLPRNSWAAPSTLVTNRPTQTTMNQQQQKQQRGTPTILPLDFLRIPGHKVHPSSQSPSSAANLNPAASNNQSNGTSSTIVGDTVSGPIMTDEQLARMLQDELFQEELRNNPEFSHLAGGRGGGTGFGRGFGGGAGTAGGSQMTGRSSYGAPRAAGGPDFFDRLSELGDTAKRRFQDLAANWTDPNRNTTNQSSSSSQSNTTNNRNERSGLLSNDLNMDDEEEEEMNFVGGGGGGGEFVELGDVRGGGMGKKKD